MMTTPPAFIAFFEAPCADYRGALPQRLTQIESLWREALSGETSAETLASLSLKVLRFVNSAFCSQKFLVA